MTMSRTAGTNQLATEAFADFTSSKTSLGVTSTFIKRAASEVARSGGLTDCGSRAGGWFIGEFSLNNSGRYSIRLTGPGVFVQQRSADGARRLTPLQYAHQKVCPFSFVPAP